MFYILSLYIELHKILMLKLIPLLNLHVTTKLNTIIVYD